ncbi:hypothetical protein B0H10DRAFT_2236957 [Mycena sp. CBHHK59/15]|nr:hypothetical protein B0H10DRAFT_2236957 [Mycena sp. CBHHK59/15]
MEKEWFTVLAILNQAGNIIWPMLYFFVQFDSHASRATFFIVAIIFSRFMGNLLAEKSRGRIDSNEEVQYLTQYLTSAEYVVAVRGSLTCLHVASLKSYGFDPIVTPTVDPTQMFHLTDIDLTSLSNRQHHDLPPDKQISAQLALDGYIFVQTNPVESEKKSPRSWVLKVDYTIPRDVSTLEEIEASMNANILKLDGELVKVNPDSPKLRFSVGFSPPAAAVSVPDGPSELTVFVKSEARSLNNEMISEQLEQVKDQQQLPDSLQPSLIYERILLLPKSTKRADFLNRLGGVCLRQWQMSHETDHLNQAICAYQDAERDCPENPTYLEDVAIGLANRWDVLGNRGDMKRAISAYERAVKVTPRGLIKALRLGGLGIFLRRRFTRLGDNDDINRAVSTCEAALQLIPEGHPLINGPKELLLT